MEFAGMKIQKDDASHKIFDQVSINEIGGIVDKLKTGIKLDDLFTNKILQESKEETK